jgi:hypothetical protein
MTPANAVTRAIGEAVQEDEPDALAACVAGTERIASRRGERSETRPVPVEEDRLTNDPPTAGSIARPLRVGEIGVDIPAPES